MTKIRVVSSVGDGYRWMAEEDGKTYHGIRHDLRPAMRRAKRLDQQMNQEASGKKDWGYLGSASTTQVSDWCTAARYTLNDFATNRDGAQDKFWKWHEQTNPKLYPGYKRRHL